MIRFEPGVRDILWQGLREADLLPSAGFYAEANGEVRVRGERSLAGIYQFAGERMVRQGSSGITEQDLIRVLGFGDLLTEYMIVPLGLPPDRRQKTIRLGALSNLIVTLYDHFVDSLADGYRLVPRKWIAQDVGINRIQSRLLGWQGIGMPKEQRLMQRLIQRYFQELRQLARSEGANGEKLEKSIRALVTKMYDAELEGLGVDGPVSAFTWRRKSIFPFLVMGLPSWMTASPGQVQACWHARWLCRIGMVLGLVDDIVDLALDLGRRSPNRIHDDGVDGGSPPLIEDYLSRRVVRTTLRVMEEWKDRAAHGLRVDAIVENAIPVTICSWFGGPGWQTGVPVDPEQEVRGREGASLL